MAFLAKAVMRSGVMRGGGAMGDSKLSEGSSDLKKAQKVLEDIKSGKISIGSLDGDILKKLGGKEGIAKFINGEGGALDRFVGKSGGFKEFGIKPIDLSRNGANEKDDIKLESPEKASEKEISFKSRVNGSFNSIKADYYDKKIFDTEKVEPVPTYTPKPGTGEVRLEGRPLEGDVKNLGKDFRQDLKELEKDAKKFIEDVKKGMGKEFGGEFGKNLENIEKDIEKLRKNIENGKDFSKDLENLEKNTDKLEKDIREKEDAGANEFSVDTKSFFHKLKNVTEVLKQYEEIAGEDTRAIDNLQVAEGLGDGFSTDSVGSPRLNRAHQNAKKGGGSFSQTSTGSDAGAYNPTREGPTRLKQNSKASGYDPARGKVSGDGPRKPLDPFREQAKRVREFYREFYKENEKKIDFANSADQQLKQTADNIDNVVGGALMAYARKELEEGLGENVPVGDGQSQNNNNNNNNDSNSLIGDKLKGKPEKDHKDPKATKDVVQHKTGVKGRGGKASVGHSLENANSHHTTGALEKPKKENSIKNLFKRMHDINENPYIKVVKGTSDQLRNVQDPTREIFAELAAKFGVSASSDDNAGQQNNNNGMGDIFSSKDQEKSYKGKTPKTSSERSKLEHHTNSQVSHTNGPKLEHSGHSARIELAKGKAEEPTPEGKSEVFGKEADQTHDDPLKRDHQILEQKEGSNKERGPDTKHEQLMEAETALEIEGEKKAMDEHDIEEAIVTVRAIKDVEEFFNGDDSKDQKENAEQRNRQVEREEQGKEIEELTLSINEETAKTVEYEVEQRREGREERREREEELVVGKIEQSREEVEKKREQEEKEEQERLVAGRMERSREAIENKKEQEEEKEKEKERLIAGRMEKSREVTEEKMEQRRKEVEKVAQRQEKAIGELEEIQASLEEVQGEAQLNVEQADQVNQKAAYSNSEQLVEQADQIQLQEGEISERERETVGPEEVTAKLERIVQASEEEGGKKGKVVGSEEVTAKLERIVQADEGLLERDEPIAQELSQSSKLAELEEMKISVDEARQQQGEGQQNRDRDFLQTQVNNSAKFLLDDAAVLEKKSGHSNEAGRSIGDSVEASISKEAMLPSDSEVPQRRDSLIEAKRATVGYRSDAEAMHPIEQRLDARVEDRVEHYVDTNLGDRVEQNMGTRVEDRVEQNMSARVEDGVEQDLGARVEDRVEHYVDTNLGDRVEQNMGTRVEDGVEQNLGARVEDGVEQNMGTRVEDGVEQNLSARVEDRVEQNMSARVEDRVEQDLGTRVEDRVEHYVDTNLGDRVEQNMGTRVEDGVEQNLGARVEDGVEQNMGTRVEDGVEQNLGARVEDRVEQNMGTRVEDGIEQNLGARVEDGVEQDLGARVEDGVEQNMGTRVEDGVEQNLGARVEDGVEQNLGARVEDGVEQNLKDEVKLENERRTYSSRAEGGQVARDSSEVPEEQKGSNQRTSEKRSLDQEAQVVETESVTNGTVPVSETPEISEIAVTNPVSDKDPEGYEKRGRNGNSKTVEQLKRSEEAKKLASEHAESSEKESETEKAARLEKDDFVSLFTSVAKPGLQTEIARNLGEDIYRQAKAGRDDIGDLTRGFIENSEKLTKDLTEYLRKEEKRLEAENNLNRQWQNEAQIREGIPAS